jgi:hypothetical protein
MGQNCRLRSQQPEILTEISFFSWQRGWWWWYAIYLQLTMMMSPWCFLQILLFSCLLSIYKAKDCLTNPMFFTFTASGSNSILEVC